MYFTAVVYQFWLNQCLTAHGLELIGILYLGGALFGVHRHASVVRVVALLVLLVVSVVVSLYVILLVLLLVAISFSSLFVPCWTFQRSPMYQVFCTVFIIGLPESVVNLFWWSPLAPSTLTLKKSRSKQNLNLKARNHTRMMRVYLDFFINF